MAYKNSGAMKFNDATDLVIRADPDGTVESVYNLADNTEYIGPYSPITDVSVKINNTTAAARAVYVVALNNGIPESEQYQAIPAGDSITVSVVKNSYLKTGSSYTWQLVSGEVEISGYRALVKSDAEIDIV